MRLRFHRSTLSCELPKHGRTLCRAPVADPRTASGGNCQLPDLAGLSPAQIAVAALNAGLKMAFVDTPAVPACPVTSHCNSVAGCAPGPVCTAIALGQCCTNGSVLFCCGSGGTIVGPAP